MKKTALTTLVLTTIVNLQSCSQDSSSSSQGDSSSAQSQATLPAKSEASPASPKQVKNAADKAQSEKEPKLVAQVSTPPSAPLTDEQRASKLWGKIQGFKNWSSPEGFKGLVESDTVHGDFVRVYANSTAFGNLKNLLNGSIVVKEGFDDEEGADLNAITVMEKIGGFSGNSGDWFFSRFDAAGKPSKINSNSCIRCHRKADNNDFSFIND